MSSTISHQLSIRQLYALKQLGDVFAPGYGQLPRFSESGCLNQIDDILAFSPSQDVKELKMLLSLLSFVPNRGFPLFVKLLANLSNGPGFIGRQCRLDLWGVKGLIFSLYYSDLSGPYQNSSGVHQGIDYHVKCHPLIKNTTVDNVTQEN